MSRPHDFYSLSYAAQSAIRQSEFDHARARGRIRSERNRATALAATVQELEGLLLSIEHQASNAVYNLIQAGDNSPALDALREIEISARQRPAP